MNLTDIPGNHTDFFYFWNFFRFPEVTKLQFRKNKTRIGIDKLPFTLHLLIGLMHNSTTAKEPNNGPVNAFKKGRQS